MRHLYGYSVVDLLQRLSLTRSFYDHSIPPPRATKGRFIGEGNVKNQSVEVSSISTPSRVHCQDGVRVLYFGEKGRAYGRTDKIVAKVA